MWNRYESYGYTTDFLAGLTSKPHHDHRRFAGLRGPFCLRLASAFNHRPRTKRCPKYKLKYVKNQ